MTSEPGGPFSDTFLTGMHLALITGDRFCAEFAHLKQAYSCRQPQSPKEQPKKGDQKGEDTKKQGGQPKEEKQ
ncbi:hypothetical protein F2P79_000816 [Pimephales promelas]|nr:hypothetical protein F2P79_000816 [Pimephales promelas]